ncbi:MAG: DUF6377 domain-containing protein [Lachnospiraceae bacterium]|nr:DUF6377 domain-containing protein [Lachnospiraceae bacterium]
MNAQEEGFAITFTPELEMLLDSLDSTLAVDSEFIEDKNRRIRNLRNSLSITRDVEQQYWFCHDLYEEYRVYDSDSAIYYTNLCSEIARDLGRDNWLDEMNIHRTYLYAATGLLDEAQKSIDDVNVDKLSSVMLIAYYQNLLFLHTHRDAYVGTVSPTLPYTEKTQAVLMRLASEIPSSDPSYPWFYGWRSLNDIDSAACAITPVKQIVDEASGNTPRAAMNAWILSRLYERVGDNENKLKYLIHSAISDIRFCNKEIASLQEIAYLLYRNGNLERANAYINYCIQCANDYKSRVRVGKLADLQLHISQAYNDKIRSQARKINLALWGMVIILLGLIAAVVFIFVQMKKLRRSRERLNYSNEELKKHISELNHTRNQLEEANMKLATMYDDVKEDARSLSQTNNAKEKYIADIFGICSDYISKLDDFRKSIYRMIVAKRFDDVRELTKTPELPHGEIKELYSNFDKIFLKVYPGFVDDFNALLRPEERIKLKKGELLNTELRIYALVRLGINDSVKISKFLHCSVQTVYNTRQRTRNKSDIPKEKFAATVQTLGKPSF